MTKIDYGADTTRAYGYVNLCTVRSCIILISPALSVVELLQPDESGETTDRHLDESGETTDTSGGALTVYLRRYPISIAVLFDAIVDPGAP